MSRRTLRGHAKTMDPATLKNRVETALQEGRPSQAVDFARTLFEVTAEPGHRALLMRASLAEAERLLAANRGDQAHPIVSKVRELAQGPDEKTQLALVFARCGNFAWANEIAQELNNSTLASRIISIAADAAICKKLSPANGLPPDFHAQKDGIIKAFTEMHAGRDDEARAALQVIGLTSPFLEWKVLARGFLAYYQQDDGKAQENWRRLDPQRMPAKLATPFLLDVDPASRAAQPPQAVGRWREVLEQLMGGGLVGRLREVQRHLSGQQQLTSAFRQVESLLPRLKTDEPRLVPRLAACFFWAIIDHGNPADMDRYRRVFGSPSEDPRLWRLEALALEHRQGLDDAHKAWQYYEKSLADHAGALPPGHADLARSLVWRHMGANAARLPDDKMRRKMNRMAFGMFGGLPRPLKPSAEACFKRSLELAPDHLDAHDALVQHYVEADQPAKALAAAKKLLKQFPKHAPSLELVGHLALEKRSYADAVTYLNRAVQSNPLDAKLRLALGTAHAARAQSHAVAGRMDKARAEFKAALDIHEGVSHFPILCQFAACELLAGEPARAEELMQQANQNPHHRLAVAYAMLVHATNLRLDKPIKDRFETEFKVLASGPAGPAAAASVAAQIVAFCKSRVKYEGQKAQEKKLISYLDKAKNGPVTEEQLQQICDAVLHLAAIKVVQNCFKQGQQLFPANPRFYLAELDYELAKPPYRVALPRVKELLAKVRELAATMAPRERTELLAELEMREEDMQSLVPFGGLFDLPPLQAFDVFGGDLDDDDDDDMPDYDWEDY